MNRIFNLHFILLSLTSFFFITANHCYDLLPKHFEIQDFASRDIGFIMSFTGIGGILVLPILLSTIDKYNKKNIFFLVLIAHALIPLLYFVNFGSNGWYALPRMLQGSMAAATMITLTTALSYVIPEEKRSKGYALFGVTGQVGLILSIVSGELIYDSLGFPFLYLYTAILFLTPLFFLHKLADYRGEQRPPKLSDFFEVFSQKRVYPALYWVFLHGAVYGMFLSFMPNVVLSAGLLYVKPFYIAFSVVVAAVRLGLAHQFDRYSRSTVLLLPLLLLPFSLFMMSSVDSYLLLVLTGMIYGFCNGIMFPVLTATLIDYCPVHFRGRMSVVFQLFFNLGIFLAANIGGRLAEYSVGVSFTTMGFFAFSGVLLLIFNNIRTWVLRR